MPQPTGRGWDLPTRLFHWALALLVVFSFATGEVGGSWLPWHMRSGYAILTLLLFRLAWGFAGSREARFTSFVRGPRAALDHARALARGNRTLAPGHNPLGGWMVVVLLALAAFQAGTGLFSNDESSHEGPLAAKVSGAVVDRMSALHSWNAWLIAAAVGVHVAAVSVYQWRWRMDVIGPMVSGPSQAAQNALALVLVAACAAAVYWLVVVYPR
ncbi:MAG TPA: cytochrome b/b6 domain-containing protein [Usitatibacter sp.]|nr:cytochrome b/b6 domain-containing protein [Usitatibacter sp.]